MSSRTGRRVFVVGVGMTRFEKPGKKEWDYPDMGVEAGKKALADAGIDYNEVQQACVGYVYGDSTCGQRVIYGLGMTGIPIYNVNNNCSTGSTALYMAKQFIEGGIADCVLALGFEKMERGSLQNKYNDRTNPMDKHVQVMMETRGFESAPVAPQMFGNAGREHMEKYGTTQTQFAKIAWKNHKHSANNPYSQFRDEYTLEQILASPKVYEPLTKLQCCPTSDGSAAAILCSEEFVKKHNLQGKAVEILAMEMATDLPSTFKEGSCIKMVGADMTRKAVQKAYEKTGLTAKDVQVIELHDCFSCNELITYEALGLCPEGQAGRLVDDGQVTYGGKWVVNPSGGLISKGHPLGATGLAQCSELCWQLRGVCGKRQVPGAKVALQHNIGLGGAVVVGLYRLGFPQAVKPLASGEPNPAVDADAISNSKSSSSSSSPASTQQASTGSGEELKADMLFDEITTRVNSEPDLVKTVNSIYQITITKNGKEKSWTVDLKNAPGKVIVGTSPNAKPDLVIVISDDDFVDLVLGKANGQLLFAQGKMKLKGNIMLALKLNTVFKQRAGL